MNWPIINWGNLSIKASRGSIRKWDFSASSLETCKQLIRSSTRRDLVDSPSPQKTLMKSFFTLASLIFSKASRIFSALILFRSSCQPPKTVIYNAQLRKTCYLAQALFFFLFRDVNWYLSRAALFALRRILVHGAASATAARTSGTFTWKHRQTVAEGWIRVRALRPTSCNNNKNVNITTKLDSQFFTSTKKKKKPRFEANTSYN